MGDEALRCSTEFRTKLWHDKVALLLSKLAKSVGLKYKYEPRGLVPWNDLRPDGVLTRPDGSELFVDVRTCLTSNPGKCKPCADLSGCSADMGATEKTTKWLPTTTSLGVAFTPFCCEDGGLINASGRALILEIAANSGGTLAERFAFEIYAFRCVYATIAKGVAASILARAPIVSGCRVLQRGGTLNLASLPLRRRTIPLSALTRLSMPQQQPPWALRAASAIDNALVPMEDQAASAIDNALEPMEDQIGVLDLETAAVSPVLRDCTRTASRPLNNPIISRRALDEAIRSFRQLAQPPPFVSVATTHAPTTVVPASHQWSNAASTAAAFEDLRLPSIFRAESNPVENGSTAEPTQLCLAQEPSLLPDGPSLAFPLALPAHTRGAAP